jgi:serine protease Do
MQGQVVGVNTAIYSPSGGSVGIGFAIPASTAEGVVTALEHGGVVSRGYLGVNIQPVTSAIAESLSMKSAEGVIVDQVLPGTPAAEAGLKSGDVITKLDGKDVQDAGDLSLRVASFKPGAKVELTYMRDGAEKTVEVALAPQTSETVAKAENANEATPALGIELAPVGQVAGAGDKGVAITGVDPNGAAAEQGLTAGDVILDVAGKPVSTPQDVKSQVASAKNQGKKAVLMRIQTAQGDRYVAVPFPKA